MIALEVRRDGLHVHVNDKIAVELMGRLLQASYPVDRVEWHGSLTDLRVARQVLRTAYDAAPAGAVPHCKFLALALPLTAAIDRLRPTPESLTGQSVGSLSWQPRSPHAVGYEVQAHGLPFMWGERVAASIHATPAAKLELPAFEQRVPATDLSDFDKGWNAAMKATKQHFGGHALAPGDLPRWAKSKLRKPKADPSAGTVNLLSAAPEPVFAPSRLPKPGEWFRVVG